MFKRFWQWILNLRRKPENYYLTIVIDAAAISEEKAENLFDYFVDLSGLLVGSGYVTGHFDKVNENGKTQR